MANIRLVPIDSINWEDACELKVKADQEDFVAPNWYSILESKYRDECFPMGIIDDQDEMVGFLMYDWDDCYGDTPGDRRLEMCRLMIDEYYQGKGYGKLATSMLISDLRKEYPNTPIYTSAEPLNEVAIGLYESLGFVKTGEIAWDEIVLMLAP